MLARFSVFTRKDRLIDAILHLCVPLQASGRPSRRSFATHVTSAAAAATATAGPSTSAVTSAGIAYEVIQGPLVKFSRDAAIKDVPTAVFVHGILGSRRNLASFAKMITEVRRHVRLACSGCQSSFVCVQPLPMADAFRMGLPAFE